MYLVLCETGHGSRYHVFTEMPESYNEDLVHKFGPMEDPSGAVESGYYHPEKWDDYGDAIAAAGDDLDAIDKIESEQELEEAEPV